jgi:hypothetical protein
MARTAQTLKSKKASAAPASKRKRKDPEVEDDLEPSAEELAEQKAAAARRTEKKKKAKSKPEPEPEPEPEGEEEDGEEGEDGEDGEDDEASAKRQRASARKKRERRKNAGYRQLAADAGFTKSGGIIAASGIDIGASAITLADSVRLLKFSPQITASGSYERDEVLERMRLSTTSVTPSVARVAQAHFEAISRVIVNEAVLRALESNKTRLDASTMYSVLRKYGEQLEFNSGLPSIGLVRFAQKAGLLGATADDEALLTSEAATNKEVANLQKKMIRAEEEKRAEARKVRADKKAAAVAVN